MRIVINKNLLIVKKIINRAVAALLATVLFCCSYASVRAQDNEEKKDVDLQLYAQAAVLMDADSGRVLYGKNEKDVLPMASTTKIMTCILALEYGNPDDIVEASAYAAGMPKVKLNVKQGEHYRMGDLLYSLMLESHNDSAVVIAEAVGGSVEEFASMMNQKARDIGCYDTYFITPNGLDAVVNDSGKVHSTTARDLAKIMAYCVMDSPAKEQFLEITQTVSYDFTDADGKRNFHCSNHNAFLGMMKEAISGKTGFTNSAGYCYVGAVESEGRVFTVALLACGWPNNRSYKWSDMKKLVTYGMERYEYRDIYERREFQDIKVNNGIDSESGTPYKEAYVAALIDDGGEHSLPYLLCEDDEVEVRVQMADVLQAPVVEHEEIGTVCYYLNGSLVKSFPIITAEAVEERTYGFVCTYLLNIFLP